MIDPGFIGGAVRRRLRPRDPFEPLQPISDFASRVGEIAGGAFNAAAQTPVVGGALQALGTAFEHTVTPALGLTAAAAGSRPAREAFLQNYRTEQGGRPGPLDIFATTRALGAGWHAAQEEAGRTASDVTRSPLERALAGIQAGAGTAAEFTAPLPLPGAGLAKALRGAPRAARAAERIVPGVRPEIDFARIMDDLASKPVEARVAETPRLRPPPLAPEPPVQRFAPSRLGADRTLRGARPEIAALEREPIALSETQRRPSVLPSQEVRGVRVPDETTFRPHLVAPDVRVTRDTEQAAAELGRTTPKRQAVSADLARQVMERATQRGETTAPASVMDVIRRSVERSSAKMAAKDLAKPIEQPAERVKPFTKIEPQVDLPRVTTDATLDADLAASLGQRGLKVPGQFSLGPRESAVHDLTERVISAVETAQKSTGRTAQKAWADAQAALEEARRMGASMDHIAARVRKATGLGPTAGELEIRARGVRARRVAGGPGAMDQPASFDDPRNALRYHVSGAIERGEGVPIVEHPLPGAGRARVSDADRMRMSDAFGTTFGATRDLRTRALQFRDLAESSRGLDDEFAKRADTRGPVASAEGVLEMARRSAAKRRPPSMAEMIDAGGFSQEQIIKAREQFFAKLREVETPYRAQGSEVRGSSRGPGVPLQTNKLVRLDEIKVGERFSADAVDDLVKIGDSDSGPVVRMKDGREVVWNHGSGYAMRRPPEGANIGPRLKDLPEGTVVEVESPRYDGTVDRVTWLGMGKGPLGRADWAYVKYEDGRVVTWGDGTAHARPLSDVPGDVVVGRLASAEDAVTRAAELNAQAVPYKGGRFGPGAATEREFRSQKERLLLQKNGELTPEQYVGHIKDGQKAYGWMLPSGRIVDANKTSHYGALRAAVDYALNKTPSADGMVHLAGSTATWSGRLTDAQFSTLRDLEALRVQRWRWEIGGPNRELKAHGEGFDTLPERYGPGAAAGGELPPGDLPDVPIPELQRRLEAEGGFTYDPQTGGFPTRGFSVSPFKEREFVAPFDRARSETQMTDYVAANGDILPEAPAHFGAWIEDGKLYLDTAVVVQDAAEAERIALKHGQEAYFDLAKKETVYVRNREGVRQNPAQRLAGGAQAVDRGVGPASPRAGGPAPRGSSPQGVDFSQQVIGHTEARPISPAAVEPGVPDRGTISASAPASNWDRFLSVWNLPKALKASFDLSAPFRQGVLLSAGHPREFFGAFGPMLRAVRDREFAIALNRELLATQRPGLYIADLTGELAQREEAFITNLAGRIPGLGASERAYVTFLNKLRADVYDHVLASWERGGKQIAEADRKGLSDVVNHFTGRGDLPAGGAQYAAALNGLFFSPRFAVSRIQSVGDALGVVKSRDSLAAREAASDLVKFVGAGLTVLTLAQLFGAQSEADPRSSNFGKIKLGDSTVDIWGGMQQPARYTAQILTGQSKPAVGAKVGQIITAKRDDTLGRYVESKLSPTAGTVKGILRGPNKDDPSGTIGRNFIGKPFSATDLVNPFSDNSLVTPISPQNIAQAAEAERKRGGSPLAGALLGSLEMIGFGVNSIDRQEPTEKKDDPLRRTSPTLRAPTLQPPSKRTSPNLRPPSR